MAESGNRLAMLLAGAMIAAAPALVMAAETIAYRYDARGRLVEVKRIVGAGAPVVTTYVLDKADNRTAKTTSGSPNTGPP